MRLKETVLVKTVFLFFVLALGACSARQPAPEADPLPSWNDGVVKQSIAAFVGQAADPSSAQFVPEDERIAVFDNDGTLWSEKPTYFQLLFILDRIRHSSVKFCPVCDK